jgi:hypothetical protein
MKNDTPANVAQHMVLKLNGDFSVIESDVEPDLDIAEIEAAQQHSEDRSEAEHFWAGRLLANRKSTRLAA